MTKLWIVCPKTKAFAVEISADDARISQVSQIHASPIGCVLFEGIAASVFERPIAVAQESCKPRADYTVIASPHLFIQHTKDHLRAA